MNLIELNEDEVPTEIRIYRKNGQLVSLRIHEGPKGQGLRVSGYVTDSPIERPNDERKFIHAAEVPNRQFDSLKALVAAGESGK